jgi:hypothetical protein
VGAPRARGYGGRVEIVLGVALVVTVIGLTSRWVRRRPGVPLSWQTAQSVAAGLHRRMHRSLDRARRTVALARRRGVATAHYEGLCDELTTTARALDDQLVLAAKLPFRARHKTLLELRFRIVELESVADRVGRTALEAASPLVSSVDDSLRDIKQRLEHHVEARAELRDELREMGL